MADSPIVLEVNEPGSLIFDGRVFRCALGPKGIVTDKHEGDGGTPAGVYPLRRVMFRADRINQPVTQLPARPLCENDGWCDDPDHKCYNCHIYLPHAASHEDLWREDHIYDVIVELGYNDNPPVPGRGSAIFMHVARHDYSPTQGCIALQIDDLLSVLCACGPGSMIKINAGNR